MWRGVCIVLLLGIASAQPQPELTKLLEEIKDWIIAQDIGSNILRNVSVTNDSIFINGNLARVVLAWHRLTGDEKSLEEGLRWCDTLVTLQHPITTSKGNDGGWWATGYGPYGGDVYIADTGTAVQTLSLCWHLSSDSGKRDSYMRAMKLYSAFVTEGCKVPPPNRGKNCTTNWVIQDGPDAGALGDGFYEGRLNTLPYTISTETTGAAFFAEFGAIAGGEEWYTIVRNAIEWVLHIRNPDGSIPYILDGKVQKDVLYQPTSYGAEGFIAGALHVPGMAQRMTSLSETTKWLVDHQESDGSWADPPGSAESQRAPRALSLMQLTQKLAPRPDPKVKEAMDRYVAFLIKDAKGAYGVNVQPIVTGFVGLAIADYLKPWCTFGVPLE